MSNWNRPANSQIMTSWVGRAAGHGLEFPAPCEVHVIVHDVKRVSMDGHFIRSDYGFFRSCIETVFHGSKIRIEPTSRRKTASA